MSASTVNLGIGVRGFYYTDVDSDVWTKIENIVEGSIAFTFSDPTETSLNVEDKADAIATLRSKDTPDRIDLSFYNLSAAELAVIMGGSASGEKWSAPISTPLITKRIRIVTEPYNDYYIIYTVENSQILAKFAGAPSKKLAEQVNISCVIQAAASGGQSIAPYTREVCNEWVPYNLIVDDTANALGFSIMTGEADEDYEFTKDGNNFSAITVNPQTGFTGNIDAADVQIRAKIASSGAPQRAAAIAEKPFVT